MSMQLIEKFSYCSLFFFKVKSILLWILLLFCLHGKAQTGPGGVGSSANNTLWLRANNLSLANGAAVSAWNDVSGNHHNASQATAANQPTFQTNQINGLPVVRFDGNNDFFDDAHAYSARTIFSVYNISSTLQPNTDLAQIWGSYAEEVHLALDARNTPGTWSFDGDPGPNSGRLGLNGAAYGSFSANPTTPNWTYDQFDLVTSELNATRALTRQIIGSLVPSFAIGEHQYGGDIAEIIVYNTTLNTAQRIIVENYLAAKYNLAIANDYYIHQSTHSFDVSGIGRVNASNAHTSSTSAGLINISNPSALGDGDYLLFGHENGDVAAWTTTESPDGGTNIRRLAREWIINETNDVGTVDITLETATLPALPAGFALYGLLVDADGDFSSGSTVYALENSVGTEYQITGLNLSDGDYLAIAAIRPAIEHQVASSSTTEPNNANVTIRLNYIPQNNVTIEATTSDGTATVAGSDYTAFANQIITITAPDTTAAYTVNINNDVITETDENLTITLANPSIGIVGLQSTHTLVINDDDNPRKIYFDAASSSALESVTSGNIPVSINLTDGSNPTTVDYAITGGTATGGGVDYTLASGTINIPAGNSTANIPFSVINDGNFEADETFEVTLSNPSNCNLDNTAPFGGSGFITHTYSIINDEPNPFIQFTTTSGSHDERFSPELVQINISTVLGTDISVDYAVTGGTATGGGVDYTLLSGTATITAGNTTTQISIIIIDDAIEELGETIEITLSNPSLGLLGANTVHTVTIIDDDVTGRLGPGGVGESDNLEFWLIADSLNQADLSSVSNWNDVSGNARSASQGNASLQPQYRTNQVNGHSTVRFDGSNDFLTGSFNYNAQMVYAVFRMLSANQNTGDLGQLWGSYSEDVQFGPDARSGGGRWSFDGGGSTQGRVSIDGGSFGSFGEDVTSPSWSYDVFHVAKVEFDALKPVTRHDIGSLISPTGHLLGADIAELAVYSIILDEAQLILIDNHYSAKYNITIGNDLYPYDAPGNFEHDLIGIGQVDISNFHLDAQGNGNLRILNPNDLNNNEFLLIGHNNGDYQANETSDVPGAVEGRLSRVWRASEVNVSSTPVDVGAIDLHFDLSGLGAVTAADLVLLVDSDNDGNFNDETPIPGATNISGNIYGFAGVTAIANGLRFTLGTTNLTQTPLPLTLLGFNANVLGETVVLHWTTANELNVSHFEVEQSENGADFRNVKSIKAQGNTNFQVEYSAELKGISTTTYFRLKMIDHDGSYIYSNKIVVQPKTLENQVALYPNPANEKITLKGFSTPMHKLQIFDVYGVDLTSTLKTTQLENSVEINIQNLPRGMYFLNTHQSVLKFLKQ